MAAIIHKIAMVITAIKTEDTLSFPVYYFVPDFEVLIV